MDRSDTIISKDLSEQQNVETCGVGSNSELDQPSDAESLLLECANLFNDNDGWKASINESIDEAVIKVKSKENDIQCKYEKVIQLRDAVIEEKNDLKSKIEVIIINIFELELVRLID